MFFFIFLLGAKKLDSTELEPKNCPIGNKPDKNDIKRGVYVVFQLGAPMEPKSKSWPIVTKFGKRGKQTRPAIFDNRA